MNTPESDMEQMFSIEGEAERVEVEDENTL